jgi:hypothetical protein
MSVTLHFLLGESHVYPEHLVCAKVNAGGPCKFSDNGKMPGLVTLDSSQENYENYSPDKGKPGELCPKCAKQNLSSLEHWQGHDNNVYPEDLLPLRLFKCQMWYWFVVEGLTEADPTQLHPASE